MNERLSVQSGKQSFADSTPANANRWTIIGAVVLVGTVQVLAQNGELQQKLAAVKQAAAENKQRLQRYQWTETIQLTLNGDAKPASENLCRYGPDGQIQKTSIGPPPPAPTGGRVKQRIIERKKEEITEYMDNVKGLLTLYVPPDPQRMEQAFQAGKVSLNPVGGTLNFVFTDYAQSGDRMTLSFNMAAKTIISFAVNTYIGEAKDVVTLQGQMATLPDGTNYVQQTTLNATAKKLVANTTNFNYQMIGGY